MDRLGTLNTERDTLKLQKLLRIKDNIENLAKKEAEKIQLMTKKQEKREKQAIEYRKALLEEAKHKKFKYDSRRLHAKELM